MKARIACCETLLLFRESTSVKMSRTLCLPRFMLQPLHRRVGNRGIGNELAHFLFPVLGKERVEHLLPVAEIRRLQACQGDSKIDQPAPRRADKQAERADRLKTLRERGDGATAV